MSASAIRLVGGVALAAAAWLIIGNLTHPIGTTAQYTDGVAFIEHTNTYWVINHWLLAASLMVTPWVLWAWTTGLQRPLAQVWGKLALYTGIMGIGVGLVHLAGIDGSALPAYQAALDAQPGAMTDAVAQGLRVVHLATFTAWTLLMWGTMQVAIGATMLVEKARPAWLAYVLLISGALGFASGLISAVQGHLTSFTDGVLLRGSSVGLTIWLLAVAWAMWRHGRVTILATDRSEELVETPARP